MSNERPDTSPLMRDTLKEIAEDSSTMTSRTYKALMREVWNVCAQTGNKHPELRDELLFVARLT